MARHSRRRSTGTVRLDSTGPNLVDRIDLSPIVELLHDAVSTCAVDHAKVVAYILQIEDPAGPTKKMVAAFVTAVANGPKANAADQERSRSSGDNTPTCAASESHPSKLMTSSGETVKTEADEDQFPGSSGVAKEWFTTKDVAALVNRKPFTVREWCRLSRIHCKRRLNRKGQWYISKDEVERLIRTDCELLPIPLNRKFRYRV